MGLDVSHDCWHGGYISFGVWREQLARAAGYEMISDVDGLVPGRMIPRYLHERYDDGTFTERTVMGKWGKTDPGDVLWVLLAHSDCDGTIPRRFNLPLAKRLEQLAPFLDDDAPWSPRGHALRFAAGLRQAHEAGEKVEFR